MACAMEAKRAGMKPLVIVWRRGCDVVPWLGKRTGEASPKRAQPRKRD